MYKKHEIDKCFELAKQTFYVRQQNKQDLNFFLLPYHPVLESVIHPLKILGFHATFCYPHTIGRSLIRNSPFTDTGIVYSIPCGCNKFYIGQSGKSLDKRLSQHKYAIRSDNQQNAINIHNRLCDHPINWSQSRELFKSQGITERNILETVCISFTKHMNINTSHGLYKIDPLVSHIVERQYKLRSVFE